jgi:LL-diaminopimelate aminotransferase
MEYAKRLKNLPFYLYPTIEAAVQRAKQKGQNIIDLSTGDPEFPAPDYLVKELAKTCLNPQTHHYGNVKGYPPFCKSIAAWYQRRFGVTLDPDKEVITFIGSKEGIAYMPLAFINPGDVALIPDPGYPTYRYAATFAGAKLVTFNLKPESNFLPDFNEIESEVADKSKIIFLNYPNNPTGATADDEIFEKAVRFANKHGLIICHDAAYSEIAFDGYKAPSLMESKGALDVGVEFHSLSKTFNMTGWRIGFAVGHEKYIKALHEVQKVFASGHFPALEIVGMKALDSHPVELENRNRLLKERRDFVINELKKYDIAAAMPRASFYIWFPVPVQMDSLSFVTDIILKTGVVLFPGIGYGDNGEGWLRIALAQELPRIKEAFERLYPYLK